MPSCLASNAAIADSEASDDDRLLPHKATDVRFGNDTKVDEGNFRESDVASIGTYPWMLNPFQSYQRIQWLRRMYSTIIVKILLFSYHLPSFLGMMNVDSNLKTG